MLVTTHAYQCGRNDAARHIMIAPLLVRWVASPLVGGGTAGKLRRQNVWLAP